MLGTQLSHAALGKQHVWRHDGCSMVRPCTGPCNTSQNTAWTISLSADLRWLLYTAATWLWALIVQWSNVLTVHVHLKFGKTSHNVQLGKVLRHLTTAVILCLTHYAKHTILLPTEHLLGSFVFLRFSTVPLDELQQMLRLPSQQMLISFINSAVCCIHNITI